MKLTYAWVIEHCDILVLHAVSVAMVIMWLGVGLNFSSPKSFDDGVTQNCDIKLLSLQYP